MEELAEATSSSPEMSRLDRLITDVALDEGYGCPCDVVIADDPDGSLLRWALVVESQEDEWPTIVVVSSDLRQARRAEELAEQAGARERVLIRGIDGPVELGEFLDSLENAGYHFVLGHLPKSNEELAYLAGATIACGDSVSLVLGGNTKHMVRTQNDVLARYASEVRASRGSGKFRCLVASHTGEPQQKYEPQVSGRLVAFGGTFAGAKMDFGGEFLADVAIEDLERRIDGGELVAATSEHSIAKGSVDVSSVDFALTVLDFGSGNGAVSRDVLAALASARVIATDVDADAVASTSATLAPSIERGRAKVTWDDGASEIENESVDVVLLNPPFHEGTRIDPTLVQSMLSASYRVLKPGGSLYLVHNSHLRYRPEVDKRFGGSRELARNAKFTVLRADKRG